MTAGYEGNRHAGLGRLGQHCQLLIGRITSATLDPREHFDSFDTTGHSRIPRRTPRLLAMQPCPAQMGAAPHCDVRAPGIP